MSTQTGAIGLPSRFDLLRTEGFPLLPVLIIGGIAFVAVFADVLAPHDPEVGNLGARFRPPVWQAGGSHEYLLGTDHLGRDVLSHFGLYIEERRDLVLIFEPHEADALPFR